MGARILVVGAGAAGLGAARELKDAGLEPIVLEARDRIGGRAWTRYDLGGHPVEMGAEFIHGTTGATWGLLARYGLDAVYAYRNHGSEVYEHVQGRLREQTDPAAGSFFDVAEQIAHIASDVVADQSVESALDRALTAVLGEYSDDEAHLYGNTFTVYTTEDLDRIGIRGIRELMTADPDAPLDPHPDWNYRVARGYSALWESVAAGLDIRLSMPVHAIGWDGEVIRVATPEGVLEADAVVVTLPLGVLKAGDVRFTPSLPEEKRAAIGELGAGAVNKVVLEFDRRFWPEEMGLLFTSSGSQGFWPSAPAGGESEPRLTWWTAGTLAREVADDLQAGVERALADLSVMFPHEPLPRLRSYTAACWATDPYARIGYSYIPVSERDDIHDRLARPAGRLFFAGEATTRPPASASVPGAFESGRRAAREALEAIEAESHGALWAQ